jgi:hypothetical protein
MTDNARQQYVAPSIERIPVEGQGVMAGSVTGSGLTDYGPGSDLFTSPTGARSRYGYTTGTVAGSSDFESMINDILTVGQ